MNKPIIFDPQEIDLATIKDSHHPNKIIDSYREQLEDLFLIRNPKFRFNKNYKEELKEFLDDHTKGGPLERCGKWVFFPWNKVLAHYLDDLLHQEVRTARNKNLITKEEQDKLYAFSVGVAGLSVGSHGAITIALLGGAKKIKLADPDIISPSNLNRMRFDFTQIGRNKAEVVAEYIYQLNPYSEISIFNEGIHQGNITDFLDGLDILVEELDDIEVKVKIRELARDKKMPVIMATDNADNVIIDIERFDLNNQQPIFHGNLEGFDVSSIKQSPQKMFEAMARIIDISLVPARMLQSVSEVGKTIYSWPQLATAATMSGSVIAYAIRSICLGEKIKEGKLDINLDAVFYEDFPIKKQRQIEQAKKFLEMLP